ncbi:MAG: hypothetical protein IPN86_18885 [Saprospiraceae bacterium]|nr:hypothetical protein [Saprospiraceae bacterium]
MKKLTFISSQNRKDKIFRNLIDGANGDINHYLQVNQVEQNEVITLLNLIADVIEKIQKKEEILLAFKDAIDYSQMDLNLKSLTNNKKQNKNLFA